jgi:hypothetical protein
MLPFLVQPRIPLVHTTDTFFKTAMILGMEVPQQYLEQHLPQDGTRRPQHHFWWCPWQAFHHGILTEVDCQLDMGVDKFLQVNNTLFDVRGIWLDRR